MDRKEIEQILPHREPMLLVDEAYLNEDGTATGYYTVKIKVPLFINTGDKIRIDTKIEREMEPFYFLSGELSVDGKICMSGRFSFAIMQDKGQIEGE